MGDADLATWQSALEALGARPDPLTDAERRSLDENGYVVLEGVIDAVWLEELRAAFERLVAQEGQSAGTEFHPEAGTRRLADLVNKGEVFDRVYTEPRVLAAVAHVLRRPFKLSSLNARDAIPGSGHQQLHADWGVRSEQEPFAVVNSIWMLDDFTEENGATRIVPGTQRVDGAVAGHVDDPAAPHPDEVLITGPAGAVAVFNAHVWHGGTENRTQNATRRALHCYFTAREYPQQQDQREYVRNTTWDRIDPAARYVLDV